MGRLFVAGVGEGVRKRRGWGVIRYGIEGNGKKVIQGRQELKTYCIVVDGGNYVGFGMRRWN